MPEISFLKLASAAAVLWGFKLILFGGTRKTGSYIELFGFEFGTGERESMGLLERWFVGVALILGGGYVAKGLDWF